MAITFAVRGSSFTAYYSPGPNRSLAHKTWALSTTTPIITTAADAGLIGGKYIDIDRGVAASSFRAVSWTTDGNIGTAITRSVLMRFCVQEAPLDQGLFWISGIHSNTGIWATWLNSDNTIRARIYNEYGAQKFNSNGAWTPTLNLYYDLVMTWTGTAAANSLKVYIDGALIFQGTPSGALTSPFDTDCVGAITIGTNAIVSTARLRLNEFVIWDEVIDPTNVVLTSGAGSLNGAARTAFVAATEIDGSIYTNPGAANVLSSTGYTFAGVSITGTYHDYLNTDPGAANVVLGHNYTFNDVSMSGSYVIPINTDPGDANVMSGTGYTFNGVSMTGSYHNPTYTNPGVGNVRLGTSYIYNDATLTGTEPIPEPDTGAAGTVDLNAILETIRYVIYYSNTTVASPVDISSGLTTRVQKVLKLNPAMIPPQVSFYPFVTCYVTSKKIETGDIAANQLNCKKKAVISVEVVGGVLNPNFESDVTDPADEDITHLMENIELTLRAYPNLNSKVTWQISRDVSYYHAPLDEQTHLRAGVLTLEGTVFY